MVQAVPTYDYETEQSDLARRQRIADAMMAQAMTPAGPTETAAGGIAVRQSPLAGLAKVLQAYLSKQSSEKVKSDQANLANRYQADLQTGMGKLVDGLNTQPGQASAVNGNNPSAYVAPHEVTAADATQARRKAVLDAIASNHPVLRDLGMNMLKGQLAGQQPLDLKTMASMSTPESVMAAPNDPTKWVPKRELKELTPGALTVDAAGNMRQPGAPASTPATPAALAPTATSGGQPPQSALGPVPAGFRLIDSKPGYDTLMSADGDTYQRTASGLKKLDQGPKVTVNNNGGNAGANELGKKRADLIAQSYDTTRSVPQMLQTLTEASTALDAGIKSGIAGNVALGVTKLAKALGMGDVDPAIANTEQFRAQMAKAVLPIIEKLKPASDTDVKFAQQAAGGDITLDDASLARLVKIAQAAGYNQLFSHQRLIDQNRNAPGMQEAGIDTFQVPFNITPDANAFEYNKASGLFGLKQAPAVAGPKVGAQAPTRSNW